MGGEMTAHTKTGGQNPQNRWGNHRMNDDVWPRMIFSWAVYPARQDRVQSAYRALNSEANVTSPLIREVLITLAALANVTRNDKTQEFDRLNSVAALARICLKKLDEGKLTEFESDRKTLLEELNVLDQYYSGIRL